MEVNATNYAHDTYSFSENQWKYCRPSKKFPETFDNKLLSTTSNNSCGFIALTLPCGRQLSFETMQSRDLRMYSFDLRRASTQKEKLIKSKTTAVHGKQAEETQEQCGTQTLVKELARNEFDISLSLEGEKQAQHVLLEKTWISKYAPKKFVELLSDEKCNRQVLKWLKSWDPYVFKLQSSKERQNLAYLSAPDDLRPQRKILLLGGPPGSGKTTLAHIISEHAGYSPVEINASDDRTLSLLKNRIYGAMEIQSSFDSDKPRCIILDELESISNQNDSKAIFAFLKEMATTPLRGGTKRKTAGITRPLICICNDLFFPALKELKQESFCVSIRPATEGRVVQRLKQICESENFQTTLPSLRLLCHKFDCDVRSCINALQFARSSHKKFTVHSVEAAYTPKDRKAHIFETLRIIFSQRRQGQRRNSSFENDSFSRVIHQIEKHGMDFEIVLAAIHTNVLNSMLSDPLLHESSRCLDAICMYDTLFGNVRYYNKFTLLRYLPCIGVEAVPDTIFNLTAKPDFPSKYFENKFITQRNKNTLKIMLVHPNKVVQTNSSYSFMSIRQAALDVGYHVNIRNSLTWDRSNKLLNLEDLGNLDTFLPKCDAQTKASIKPRMKKHAHEIRTFFGSNRCKVMNLQSDNQVRLKRLRSQNDVEMLTFFFKEGYTNAIRRPVKVYEFLRQAP